MKKATKKTFYPLEAFKLNMEQINSLLMQNTGYLRIYDEILKADSYIEEMRENAYGLFSQNK